MWLADGGGDRWRDCFRFLNEIFGELWEDLPYHLPFLLNIAMSFCRLAWKEVVVKVIKVLIDQRVGRSMERNKGLNGRRFGRFPRALQKSHWGTCNNSSTISHSNISATTHHTHYSIFDATNSHTHSHTTDHLHYTNTTTISITNLTPIISPKQPRRDGCLHLG